MCEALAKRLYPLPAEDLPVGSMYLDLELPRRSSRDSTLPYVAVNMVGSIDGRVAVSGKANGIGSAADRRAMRNLRSLFDAVLRGAGTLRAERISAGVPDSLVALRESRGQTEQPYEITLTKTGRVPLRDNLLGATPDTTIVVSPERTGDASDDGLADRLAGRAVLVRAPAGPDGSVLLPGALRLLKSAHGVDQILVEGGPRLNHALISASLVEDLFLTIAPKLLGGTPPEAPSLLSGVPLPETPERRPELRSVHLAGQELFLKYGL